MTLLNRGFECVVFMREVLEMSKGKRSGEKAILLLLLCLVISYGVALAQQDATQGNPRVQIISPQDGATFVKENIIPITYQAWSPDGTPLVRAEAYVDGIRGDDGLAYNPPATSVQETLEWDATFFKDGPHTIVIRVFDARNRVGEASVTIYKGPDVTKPKAEILSPKSGSVIKGKVAIIARFEDDRKLAQVGIKATAQDERRKVSILYAKGGGLKERVYEVTVIWDTTAMVKETPNSPNLSPAFPDGLYILQAWAVDGQGQEAFSPEVLVTVRNQVAEPVIQRPEVTPRTGQRPITTPTYGGVVIARSPTPRTTEPQTPQLPSSSVTIIPAPVPSTPRQTPSVELATRIALSEGLKEMISSVVERARVSFGVSPRQIEPAVALLAPRMRGEPEVGVFVSRWEVAPSGVMRGRVSVSPRQIEPAVALLAPRIRGEPEVGVFVSRWEVAPCGVARGRVSVSPRQIESAVALLAPRTRGEPKVETPVLEREVKLAMVRAELVKHLRLSTPLGAQTHIALPKAVERELATVSKAQVRSMPVKAEVGRGGETGRAIVGAQPSLVTPAQVQRPIISQRRVVDIEASANERGSIPLKAVVEITPIVVQLTPTELPIGARTVRWQEVTRSEVKRALVATVSLPALLKPEVVLPHPSTEPRPTSPRVEELAYVRKLEAISVQPAVQSRMAKISPQKRSCEAPKVAMPTVSAMASVSKSSVSVITASVVPKAVRVGERFVEQKPSIVLPAGMWGQVGRVSTASLTSASTKRLRSVSVPAPSQFTSSVVLPSIPRHIVGRRPAVVIVRRRTSFTYTVQRGDTLCGLARKFGLSLQELMRANKLGKPIKLRVGQTLVIPRLPISVRYSGRAVNTDVQPFLLFDRAVTPFRSIMEFAGGFVDWLSSEKRVIASWNDKRVRLTIDNPFAVVNEEPVEMKPAPFLLLNRTMVPVRLFEHIFELPVTWNPQDGTVEIGTAVDSAQGK